MMDEFTEDNTVSTNKYNLIRIIAAVLLLLMLSGLLLFKYLSAPAIYEGLRTFDIEKGMTVRDIAEKAGRENIVRSELFLYAAIITFHDPTNIHAGTYIFYPEDDVFMVAKKLAEKEVQQELVSITIPEGMRSNQAAAIASDSLEEFDEQEYIALTEELEGYLFPETYFVPKTFTASDFIEMQRATYEERLAPLRDKIEQSNFTEYEVLTLASIIEREANSEESMKMVSGILQNRLEIDMPLQADATIEYVLDTPLDELPEGQLASELRETESPYNTYLNTGLTPTPIGNPGMMSIKAVLEPTDSDYFYYITDENGDFYYAKTLSEHNQNVSRYLR